MNIATAMLRSISKSYFDQLHGKVQKNAYVPIYFGVRMTKI